MLSFRSAVVAFAITVPLTVLCAQDTDQQKKKKPPPAGKTPPVAKRPGFTISKETTYITEPLTEDGYPDYFAAWEREYSRGVTPKNNAVVTLMRAFGPDIVPKSQSAEFYGKLGVSPPPKEGKYFIPEEVFIARRQKAKKNTKEQSPESAEPVASPDASADEDDLATKMAWLAEIDQALDVAVEASKRTHWYEPLLAGEEPSMICCAGSALAWQGIPGYRPCDLAVALLVRAAYRSDKGKHDDALEDLLAAHRLARLIGKAPGDRGWLSAYGINAGACELDEALASSGKVPSKRMEQYLKELQRLEPPSVVLRQLEYERYMVLEAMTRIGWNGTLVLASVAGAPAAKDPAWQKQLASASVSDRPLKITNSLIDLLISAAREPTYQRRVAKIELAGFAVWGIGAGWSGVFTAAFPKANESAIKSRERPAITMLSVMLRDQHSDEMILEQSGMFYPLFVREVKAAARLELATASWALALYRAEHGRYPKTLADCSPRYLPRVPRDPFRDAPLVYRLDGEGFILYSVGPNGRDDKGENTGRRLDLPHTDDICLGGLP